MTRDSFTSMTQKLSAAIQEGRPKDRKSTRDDSEASALLMISLIQGLALQTLLNPEFKQDAYKKVVLTFLDYINS